LAAFLVIAVSMFAVAEISSSVMLIYHYRLNGKLAEDDISILSSVSLVNKLLGLRGFFPPRDGTETLPHEMLTPDNVLGWSLLPGQYTLEFKYRVNPFGDWEILPTKVTIQR
jgi:hypothetical protein